MDSLSKDVAFRFLKDIAANLANGDVTFPTFTAATIRVRQALEDANVSNDQLARVVASEPLLGAKLVRLANSAAMNPGGKPINDVRSAIVRVGFAAVKTVAVAVAVDQLRADRAIRPHRERAEAAWRHSIHVGALAHTIATHCSRLNAEEALFAGLVHDIGYFYLLWLSPRYPELALHPAVLYEIVAEWHPAIGRAILHDFNVSEAIMDAVADHESSPPRMPPRTIADIVALANAAAARGNPARDGSDLELNEPDLAEVLREHRDDIDSLMTALRS